MLDRDACERRVYRLATLLTGSPMAATAVITDVVHAREDVREVDSAHLDRLTVLRSREIKPGRIVDPALPDEAATALAALTAQQREAWIFHRVYALPPREIARAMDCSTAATQKHLELADAAIARCDVAIDDIIASLRQYSLSLDVPVFFRAARRRRRRVNRLIMIGLIAGGLVTLIWAVRTFGPALVELPPDEDGPSPPAANVTG